MLHKKDTIMRRTFLSYFVYGLYNLVFHWLPVHLSDKCHHVCELLGKLDPGLAERRRLFVVNNRVLAAANPFPLNRTAHRKFNIFCEQMIFPPLVLADNICRKFVLFFRQLVFLFIAYEKRNRQIYDLIKI